MAKHKPNSSSHDLNPPITDVQDEQAEPSRTQIKRQMQALKTLGEKLIHLKPQELTTIPMSEALNLAIQEMHRLKQNEAKRRHLQYVGKIMRNEDVEKINQALALLDSSSTEHKRMFHQLETFRHGFLNNQADIIQHFYLTYPEADRSYINNLVRNSHRETAQNKSPLSSRKLFQYFKSLNKE